MLNLKGKQVKHKFWGVGTVVEHNEGRIEVAFSIGVKSFAYPTSFEEFLKCCDEDIQEQIIDELNANKKLHLNKLKEFQEQKSKLPPKMKMPKKENIAFKCNFCDGGADKNHIGYRCACSDELIKYNIEVAQHKWCCDENCYCKQYYDGIITDKATVDEYSKNGEAVCYESQMLRDWNAFAGYSLNKENPKPLKLSKVQCNSLAILTTRYPYVQEKDRIIFGVFLVDDAYEGDNRDSGYVTSSFEYRLSLSQDEAKQILFWNYYYNENATNKIAWGQGLHRYINDIQSACILRDIAQIKENTPDHELAKKFFNHFCDINKINKDTLPKSNGALKR